MDDKILTSEKYYKVKIGELRSTGQIQPMACLGVAQKQKLAFILLNGPKKKKINSSSILHET